MTTVHSQNGWLARADTSQLTRFTAAAQGWWAANADVAVVFTEFIERFDREVEKIIGPVLDDWSWANRLVRGSTSVVSNHGSATAIDINALQHGRGQHGTFSDAKATKMRRIKNAITDDAGRPVLRLGMDYTTTVDDMHVEVNADAARVKQAANKIRARHRAEAAAREEAEMAELQINPDTDQWVNHKLTDADAEAIGGTTKPGQASSWSSLLRFPPAVARLRREVAAGFRSNAKASEVVALTSTVETLQTELAAVRALVQGLVDAGQASTK